MEETLNLEQEETIHNGDQPMAEDVPQNPTTAPAPAPASDSDSDSDNEAQQNAELQTLETELSCNPSNYDAHVQVPTSNIHSLKLWKPKKIEMFFCLLFGKLSI